MKHQDKVVFVTGAGQGMGQAIVKHFAAEGAKVAAIDINQEAAEATAAAAEGNVIAIACDISNSESVKGAMAQVKDAFGRLDVVVNNAGVGSVDAFLDTPDENWERVIGVNLTGTFLCCREGARLMSENGSGVIINVSSSAAMSGEGPSHYVASKAGVIGLTRSIARELAPSGIRVNTLVPGATNTPMMQGIPDEWMEQMISAIPLGRMAEPEDIARVASFLASDDAGFITGQNIAVNGGMVFI
ncbi:3-oxoacyl-[acyl-carrier protein] reductase [Marinobacterium halophilum]|uniref:3-oxoacyl-[acyl-carrier protein] reductase n=1 Tax=Marinobacterium halophilum TaxID=267374 RepID=A0A2P8ETR7_9GAMM|nr:SDR family NAD(P)-dependent oxidoreductase [Marinobacterium halophilum]PSL12835.1 3-oxoacyl-[acyl-carrier protein] reductase [Marinobacterium halophilum]